MTVFNRRRLFVAAPVVSALAISLSGCAGAPAKDPVPVSSVTGLPTGPVDTGTFPDLNIKPGAAAGQFSSTEKQDKTRELLVARNTVQAERSQSPATVIETRRTLEQRKKRPAEVIGEIEGKPATNRP